LTPPDLAVLKTGPSTVPSGFDVTYTITVSNHGPADATGLTLTDAFTGSAVDFSSISQPAGWTCVPPVFPDTTFACTAPSLAAGQSSVFTLVLTTSGSDTPPGEIITNTATITGSPGPDPVAGNNSSTVTTTTVSPP
jgi:hypothetical protein